ncbi:hypothetical protein NDU88_007451 [Pleurodeles waltl]|uniref:Uncharacterized protein n=1 Tax=Pleurodeles waltl TaxID=8319 RepID=A0AAV7NT53_PLEWA|nr:hypothetical protein NDU88_007451 [Pleurodeles waltl]
MHGTRAFPFSVRASKQDGCQGNEKARARVVQRAQLREGRARQQKAADPPQPSGKDSPSQGRPDTLPLHKISSARSEAQHESQRTRNKRNVLSWLRKQQRKRSII